MQGPSRATPEALQLSEFLKIVRNRKILIFSVVMVCVLAAVAVTAMLPKWYRATATIRIQKPQSEVALFKAQGPEHFDANYILSEIGVIESKKILNQVADHLDLDLKLAEMIGYPGRLNRQDTLLQLTRNMLFVENRARTDLVDIQIEAREGARPSAPELAATIANEIARVYEADRIEFATSDQTAGIEKLKEELAKQQAIVTEQRDHLENLRGELDIAGADVNTQAGQMEIETLRQLERTLSALKIEAISRKTRYERFAEVPPPERIRLVNSELIPDRNIQDLLQAYMLAEQTASRYEQRLGEAHPELIAARENYQQLRRQLDSLLSGYEKSLQIGWQEAQARVEAMETEVARARAAQIVSASSKVRIFEEAAEKLRDEENLMRAMRISLRQREIDFQVPKRTIEILNLAAPPHRPSRPNWIINIGLATLLGMLLGTAAAYIMEFIDTSFRSIEDMEKRLGLPMLGVVSRNRVMVDETNYNTHHAEPYRVIQTNLELARGDLPAGVVVFQSAGPGEGKSTTLHNVAAVLGIAGHRVLVIDTDLRRPSQHSLFGVSRDLGLTDHMRGTCPLQDVIHATNLPNVDFIPSGRNSGDYLNLLHGRQMSELVEQLRKRYDKVLLDSPPVIGISDASVLARIADGVIFVVQHRRNPQSMTVRARQIVNSVGGHMFGTVLNQVPEDGDEDYNYYTANYQYYDRTSPTKAAGELVSSGQSARQRSSL